MSETYNLIGGAERSRGNQIGYDKRVALGFYGEEQEEDGVFPNTPNNIYAVGDIHGDSEVLMHVLVDLAQVAIIDAGVDRSPTVLTNDNLNWRDGNNSWVVFCGDLIDRHRINQGNADDEDSELAILKTLDRLDVQARLHGGRILILLGNHEMIYNFTYNDDRYISAKGKYAGRQNDFNIGSEWAKWVSSNTFSAIRIQNVFFGHGGFCRGTFVNNVFFPADGLEPVARLNNLIRKYLNGDQLNAQEEAEMIRQMNPIRGAQGIFECRDFGEGGELPCYQLNQANGIFSNLRIEPPDSGIMVIGHTPQFLLGNGINAVCNNQVWRIDVGMTRGFDFSTDRIIEILNEQFTGLDVSVEEINSQDPSAPGILLLLERDVAGGGHERKMAILHLTKDVATGNYIPAADPIITQGLMSHRRRPILQNTDVALVDRNVQRIRDEVIEAVPAGENQKAKQDAIRNACDIFLFRLQRNQYNIKSPVELEREAQAQAAAAAAAPAAFVKATTAARGKTRAELHQDGHNQHRNYISKLQDEYRLSEKSKEDLQTYINKVTAAAAAPAAVAAAASTPPAPPVGKYRMSGGMLTKFYRRYKIKYYN